ncbi:MAG: nuclease [Candidatus Kapaibacterium sp.]|nr:MAG: nuclease [Candidatus Kapabacteria bacterium]
MRILPEALLSELYDATEGLFYPSETDAALEPFLWQNIRDTSFSIEKLLLVTRHRKDTPVDGLELADFFAPVIHEEEWMDDSERETAKRFRELQETLEKLLANISVYRVGEVNIDVYIVGKTDDGYYAGVSTHLVET